MQDSDVDVDVYHCIRCFSWCFRRSGGLKELNILSTSIKDFLKMPPGWEQFMFTWSKAAMMINHAFSSSILDSCIGRECSYDQRDG